MNADGSGARQITNLSTEAGGVLFSPDGKKLVFTSNVYPDCPDDACDKNRLDAEKNSKVKRAATPRCCIGIGRNGRPSAARICWWWTWTAVLSRI